MKQLKEVVNLVVDKYAKEVNLILSNNCVTLEYLINKNEDKDAYEIITIKEFEDKLEVSLYNEKFDKIVDIEELDNIIQVVSKHSKAKPLSENEINYIKEMYPVGTEIQLIRMYDFIRPVPPNTKGIVTNVDDLGTIHIEWENGSTLGLAVGTDEFKVLNGKGM